MQKQYKLTKERLEELKAELEHLKTVREHEVAELIKEARGFGDLSENSEYDEAKNEQGKLYSRIAELEAIIPNAIVIDETAALDKGANIGTTVVTERLDNGMKAEFVLVGSQEANPKAKPMRLSDESPFGKAVMGHHVDEIVTVEAPTMSFEVRILSITR
ncbi:MAG: transcription elongation factor GreA [Clostridia bacterium]|nr:transcription elongation factor GreA [Clostridia bacterium]MDD7671306.1 transcription elongation factor GreA [Clostridia bacterium]MDY2929630.1 transcription elongation factor GreA [Clostridiaceae bacterium]